MRRIIKVNENLIKVYNVKIEHVNMLSDKVADNGGYESQKM